MGNCDKDLLYYLIFMLFTGAGGFFGGFAYAATKDLIAYRKNRKGE